MYYVALLRGIMPTNPSMRNEKLRAVFTTLGFANVRSVIASGNIVFEHASEDAQMLEARIEKALQKDLSLAITTIVRSQDELHALIKRNPFQGKTDARTSYFNVTFLKHPPKEKPEIPFTAPDNTYAYVDYDNQALASTVDLTAFHTPDLMQKLEKQFGKAITTRTWKTIHRIVKKMEDTRR